MVITNTETGVKFDTVTTGTGNYTLLQLPVGTYSLAVEKTGFSKYEQTNIQVQVAVTTRVDVVLNVGSATESVTVTAESSQLKTENAEQSMTVTGKADRRASHQFRNRRRRHPQPTVVHPNDARRLLSTAGITSPSTAGPMNFKIVFEGQQADDPYSTQVSDEIQPSVEAIEQFTLQTSNFTAEFGGVGNGGIYNFTSKSGTNQYHGSAYNYIENTVLNAGIPFTNDGTGHHQKW